MFLIALLQIKCFKNFNSVFLNGDIFFHDADSNIITFLTDDMGFNTVDLNNINLDDDNFDKDDPETINHVRLMT